MQYACACHAAVATLYEGMLWSSCRAEAAVGKGKAKGGTDFSWSSPGLAAPEDDAAPRCNAL